MTSYLGFTIFLVIGVIIYIVKGIIIVYNFRVNKVI